MRIRRRERTTSGAFGLSMMATSFASGGVDRFPEVLRTNTGTDAASATSATVQLPANIGVGQLLIMLASFDGAVTNLAATGWTVITGSTSAAWGLYKFTDGVEGSTVATSWTTARLSKWRTLLIGGAHASTPPELTSASGTSATPDPGAITASWGIANNLFIVHGATIGGPFTAVPTNYDSNIYMSTGVAGAQASATRNIQAATTNPGAFASSTSDLWRTLTIVVRPI